MSGNMQYKLRGFDVTNSQRGWVSDCCFTVETASQFTPEEHVVRQGSCWLWLAIVKSWWLSRQVAADMAAKPGERAAKGWS